MMETENGSHHERALEFIIRHIGRDFYECPIYVLGGDWSVMPEEWCQIKRVHAGEEVLDKCKCDRNLCNVADCWRECAMFNTQESFPPSENVCTHKWHEHLGGRKCSLCGRYEVSRWFVVKPDSG